MATFRVIRVWLCAFAVCRLCVEFETAAQQHRPTRAMDSLAPARSALRAFGFAEFLSRFPKQLKSVNPVNPV